MLKTSGNLKTTIKDAVYAILDKLVVIINELQELNSRSVTTIENMEKDQQVQLLTLQSQHFEQIAELDTIKSQPITINVDPTDLVQEMIKGLSKTNFKIVEFPSMIHDIKAGIDKMNTKIEELSKRNVETDNVKPATYAQVTNSQIKILTIHCIRSKLHPQTSSITAVSS